MNIVLDKLLAALPEEKAKLEEELQLRLSDKGMKKFFDRIGEERGLITKLPVAQRPKRLHKILDEVEKCYAKGTSSKGTRADNEFINSKKMKVLQIDPKTGQVVAEHESVQAAHRNTGVNDSSINHCCHNADPNSPLYGKWKGYKTAGGFAWKFAKAFEPVTEPEQASED